MDQYTSFNESCKSYKVCCSSKRFSLRAIIAGALVGLGISFLLSLFGLAIGVHALKSTGDQLTAIVVGGLIGVLIGTIVSTFTSGWVAGRLGTHACHRNYGAIYGFTAWCLALGVMVVMAVPINHYISYYSRVLANPNSALTNLVTNSPMAGSNSLTTQQQSSTVTNGNRVNSEIDQTQTAANGKTEDTVNKISLTLFITFIIFFIGALASCIGGYVGFIPRAKCRYKGVHSEYPQSPTQPQPPIQNV